MDIRIEELNHVQRLHLVVDYLMRVRADCLLIETAQKALEDARRERPVAPPPEPVPEKVAGYKSQSQVG